MGDIRNKDLVGLVMNELLTPEEAMERCKRLGLDHRELARFFDIDLPDEEKEDEAPVVVRVTGRGVPFKLPDDRQLPYLFAGRKAWTRTPQEQSTHELTETQYRDVMRKVESGTLFLMKEERIPKSKPTTAEKSSPAASGKR